MREKGLHLCLLLLLAAALCLAAASPAWLSAIAPGCRFRELTGWNCPFCGMTRDLIALAHGETPLNNPFSAPFFLLLFGVYPAAVVRCLFTGRDLPAAALHERHVGAGLAIMFLSNNAGRLFG